MDKNVEAIAAHEPLVTLITTQSPTPTSPSIAPTSPGAARTPVAVLESVCKAQHETPTLNLEAPVAAAAPGVCLPAETARSIHIPYILNGELFSIQTQEGENVTVKCCHCPPDRVYRGSVRSTGNFHMHIKRRHPDLMGKLHEMKVCALLERRDRFIKNRKNSQRNSRRSAGASSRRSPKVERHQAISPTSLLHTHKLKIKAAFQRHQLQQQQQQQQQQQKRQQQLQEQQEQSAVQNWNEISPFLLASMTQSNGSNAREQELGATLIQEQPLNYSLKQYSTGAVNLECSAAQVVRERIEIESNVASKSVGQNHVNMLLTPLSAEQTAMWCEQNNSNSSSSNYQTFGELQIFQPYNETQEETAHVPLLNHASQQTLYDCATTINATTVPTPCPSTVSSYGSERSIVQRNDYHPFNVVKNEQCLSEQPVDLTKQTTGLSGSSGIASATPSLVTAVCQNSFDHCPLGSNSALSLKWEELLLQVANSLQGIRSELQTRNQINSKRNEINTKRLCLDVAKFKYLHPNFNFQY